MLLLYAHPHAKIRIMLRYLLAVVVLLLACAGASAQDEKPLGDIARENNKNAQPKKAKVVLDDDTPGVKKKPAIIPAIDSNGMNSDAIIAAILKYRKDHTDAETEQLVKDWYEDNDSDLQNAIDENKRIENAVAPTYTTEEEYQRIVRERIHDLLERKENGLLIARIQQTFIKVRNGLFKENIKYEWFKVRCGNGNCNL